MLAIQRFRLLSAVSFAALASAALISKAQQPVARYSATAVDVTAAGSGQATTPINIVISRWSTDAERDRLVSTLTERGGDAALSVLRDLPRAGSLAATGSVGFEVRFARRIPMPEGGERVILVTERPISFWEQRDAGRSTQYPFTLVEMRVGPDGKGEGKVSFATKIIVDPQANTMVLENYTDQPIRLQNVTRQ